MKAYGDRPIGCKSRRRGFKSQFRFQLFNLCAFGEFLLKTVFFLNQLSSNHPLSLAESILMGITIRDFFQLLLKTFVLIPLTLQLNLQFFPFFFEHSYNIISLCSFSFKPLSFLFKGGTKSSISLISSL
uniref:Uncharacterized protein n=1 Tax=Hymenolepis diminuta TaxID=6216 RepID=A0A0R3SAE3_HYMDI